MTYRAYEVQSGTSVMRSLQAHCRHLTRDGAFSSDSTPALARVEQWIEEAYYDIQAHLAAAGYSTAVAASNTPVLTFLQRINTHGAVVQVELAHPITGNRGEPNDRYKQYAKMYQEGLSMLASDALVFMGLERTTSLGAFVGIGGVSRSEKRNVYDNADAVQPRFPRGFGGRDPRNTEPAGDPGTAV